MNVSKRTRHLLLAATLLAGAGGGIAIAQTVASGTYDPAQLPTTQGRVAQYSLSPRGDVDGLILADGTEVHLPPHLGTELVFLVKPGDAVTIHGLKARNVAMVQAMQVTNDGTGKSVTDTGPRQGGPDRPASAGPNRPKPPGGPDRGSPLQAEGTIKSQLHGPRGDLNGVLLQDGTIIRMPPPEAARREAALAVGKTVFVRGPGTESSLGRVVDARTIGTSAQDAVAVAPPPPPPPGSRAPAGPDARRPGGALAQGAAPAAPPPPPGSPVPAAPDASNPAGAAAQGAAPAAPPPPEVLAPAAPDAAPPGGAPAPEAAPAAPR